MISRINQYSNFSHNIPPIFKVDSKILILGSFPSKISRSKEFYYMNKQNRFWGVIFKIFDYPLSFDILDRNNIIINNNLALWDVVKTCDVVGSKDSSIKNIIYNDIEELLKQTSIEVILFNGRKAESLFNKKFLNQDFLNGISLIYLPSTSPANSVNYSFEQLISYWSIIKKFLK